MTEHSLFYFVWMLFGIIYFLMTLIAYGRAKHQHKMAVLSGWWCFFPRYFPVGNQKFLLVGKILMIVIIVCLSIYITKLR